MKYHLKVVLADRDGRTGSVSMRFQPPVSVSVADTTTAGPAIDAIAAISDARVVQYKHTWSDTVTGQNAPGPASNVRNRALIVLRTVDDEYVGIVIPSPKNDAYEQTGDYAGIKIRQAVIDNMLDFFNASFVLAHPLDGYETAVFIGGVGVRIE